MGYEDKHKQSTQIVKFKLKDGSEFGYRPMTGGEENDYLEEYLVKKEKIDPVTGQKRTVMEEDYSKINKVRSYFVEQAPYPDWNQKTKEEKWEYIRSLRPEIFSEIIQNINRIQKGDTSQKKNLSGQSANGCPGKNSDSKKTAGSTGECTKTGKTASQHTNTVNNEETTSE